jgi:hypothetical protein
MVFTQVEAQQGAWQRYSDPQYFPARAQAYCLFAQVIHRLVHRKMLSRCAATAAATLCLLAPVAARRPRGCWCPGRCHRSRRPPQRVPRGLHLSDSSGAPACGSGLSPWDALRDGGALTRRSGCRFGRAPALGIGHSGRVLRYTLLRDAVRNLSLEPVRG